MNTSNFTKMLLTKLNEILPTYFEEADPKATFPYAVVQNINPRADQTQMIETIIIDLAIYQKESPTLDVEQKLDELKELINRTNLNEVGKFSSYLYFESSDNVRDQDGDLICRSATIQARVFYI